MMNVAVVVARGGSQRIPRKNIRPFLGRPILHYVLDAAERSGVFDKIIVSTDSEEIAGVAREAGAEIPFMRPAELADGKTPLVDVFVHAIEAMRGLEWRLARACFLLPTAPLLQSRYLRDGLAALRRTGAPTAVSVTSFPYPIHRALRINDAGRLEMFWPEHEFTHSQQLPAAYHDAGQFYWADVSSFLANPRLLTAESVPVVLPRYLVCDIDTEEDWQVAEALFEANRLRGR
jgi:pseudaminic acid cytidylyltransferase